MIFYKIQWANSHLNLIRHLQNTENTSFIYVFIPVLHTHTFPEGNMNPFWPSQFLPQVLSQLENISLGYIQQVYDVTRNSWNFSRFSHCSRAGQRQAFVIDHADAHQRGSTILEAKWQLMLMSSRNPHFTDYTNVCISAL